MVNKTQFYKTKVALAVVLSLGLAACGDSDGDSSNATSNSVVEDNGGNTVEQVQGAGSVQGTVLDTNGLPVMGATVSLAGQTIVTDASGYYHFSNVAAPGVTGTNGDDNGVNSSTTAPYSVTITAPAGYASATVNVTAANIQVDSGNNGNINSGQTEASGQQTTWFDGFLAQATTAVLPKFASSVTGVLRDCNTGAALPAGVPVALDFTGISSTITSGTTGTNSDEDGNVTIGVKVFSTETAADGSFTFTEIPTDSIFTLAVEGYSEANDDSTEATGTTLDSIATTAEGIVNNLGTQEVCLITSNDEVNPYIASVNDTISDTTGEGFTWQVLGEGVDGTTGIVLKFNEALDVDNIDVDNVLVTVQNTFSDVTDGESSVAIESAVLADDGMSMTVTLVTALDPMTKFSIWMPRHEYQDTSGNRIVTGEATTAVAGDDLLVDDAADLVTATNSSGLGIPNDVINSTPTKLEYVRTRLCTYISPDVNAEGATGEQLVKLEDTLPVNAFWSNVGISSSDISSLNGQAGTTGPLLEALSDARGGSAVDFYDNVAVIVGSMGNASGISASSGSVSLDTPNVGEYSVTVTGAEHGDEVTITPTAAFGIIGTPFVVTLEDKLRPTTVLQDSYDFVDTFATNTFILPAHVTTDGSDDPTFGDGGELSNIGSESTKGAPNYYITPRLFAQDRGDDHDAGYNNRVDQFRELALLNTQDSDGDAYVTSTTNFVYDVNAWAAWSGVSRTIGFAFDENVELLATTSPSFTIANGTVSSTLTGFVVNNETRTEDYVSLNTDRDDDRVYMEHGLVQADIDNVLALANNDHGAIVSFSGVVADDGRTSNVAAADAAVVIRDAIPPFVTKAELGATTFVVEFNEAVKGTLGDIVITDPTTGTALPALAMTSASLSTDGLTATWSGTSLSGLRAAFTSSSTVSTTADIDDTALFGNVAENETVEGDFSFAETAGGSVFNHSLLSWSSVQDLRGNSWGAYTALYVDTTDATATALVGNGVIDSQEDGDSATNGWRLAVQDLPMFLATDTIAAFEVSVRFAVTNDTSTAPKIDEEFVVTITSSHPLETDGTQWGGSDATTLTEAELLANFAIVDTAQGDFVATAGTCLPGTTIGDTDNSGVAGDGTDYCVVDMDSVSSDWNVDFTELTITFTQDSEVIEPSAGFEFRKITDAVSGDWADRLGHVLSTIPDSVNNDQSQDVKRTF